MKLVVSNYEPFGSGYFFFSFFIRFLGTFLAILSLFLYPLDNFGLEWSVSIMSWIIPSGFPFVGKNCPVSIFDCLFFSSFSCIEDSC